MAQSMAASVSWGLPAEEPDPLEIDVYHAFTTMEIVFTTMEIDFYRWGIFFIFYFLYIFFSLGNFSSTLTFYRPLHLPM